MQTIVYPLYDRNNRISLNLPETIAACANNAQSGTFLVGKNHYWHGGIHLSPPFNAIFSDIVLQSIAKGKVVAYRLHEDWEQEEYSGKQLQYSRNFILIQHDLEVPYYKEGATQEKLFQGYKFYSLYMHVAPASILQANKALPWFLATTRQNLAADQVIARGSPVTLLTKEDAPAGNSDTPLTLALNGLVHVQLSSDSAKNAITNAWLPIGKIAFDKFTNQYVTAQPIKYLYTENKTTLSQNVLNKIISLKERDYIPIETGDILGMMGGTIIGDSFKDQLIHFEIFADNIDFLDNIFQRASTNTSPAHTALNMATNYTIAAHLKSKNITNQHSFGAGRFYYQSTPSNNGSNWKDYYYIGADQSVFYESPPSGKHYLLEKLEWPPRGQAITSVTIDAATTPVLNVVSDAQWKEGPHAWKIKNGREFLNEDGFWDRCTRPEASEQVVVQQTSEWSDKNINQRFESKKSDMGAQYQPFLKYVEGHCFWKDVRSNANLPRNAEVWHFHPTGFIAQLARLCTPYHNAHPMKLQRYLERHCNESLRFLKTRQQQIQSWKDAGLPESHDPATNPLHHAIAKSFSTWFGYPYAPALAFYTAHNNNKLDNDGNKELLTLPVITTLVGAVDRVLGIIDRSINAFEKQIDVSKMSHGFVAKDFARAGAYVFFADENKNIHLCAGFLYAPQNIDNHAKLCQSITHYEPAGVTTVNGRDYPTPPKESTVHHNTLNVMVHECSHFYDIGLLSTDTEKRGQYDLTIYDPIELEYIEPYGEKNCIRIAAYNPHAALCNADNFAQFIAEHTDDDYEDTYTYF